MIIATFAFYLFSIVAIASAGMVVTARNPVYAVLFLILTFFSTSGLFILLGAEFLAMLLIVVYVGAVMVLFLFVVMMLNIDFIVFKREVKRHLTVGGAVAVVLLFELITMIIGFKISGQSKISLPIPPTEISNTHALGEVIYTNYAVIFEISGLILLVAMIGTIVLTLRQRDGVRKQRVSDQLARRSENTVVVVKVKSGEGVKL